MFYTAASTKSDSTVKATQAMLEEINELKTKPFTAAELASAKDQLLNSFIFHYDSKEKVLTEATELEFYGYPADFLTKYRAGIEAVIGRFGARSEQVCRSVEVGAARCR